MNWAPRDGRQSPERGRRASGSEAGPTPHQLSLFYGNAESKDDLVDALGSRGPVEGLISGADMRPPAALKAKCLKMGDAAPQSPRTDGALRYHVTRPPPAQPEPNPVLFMCLRRERRTVGRPISSQGCPQGAGRVRFPPGCRICLGIQVVELITRDTRARLTAPRPVTDAADCLENSIDFVEVYQVARSAR